LIIAEAERPFLLWESAEDVAFTEVKPAHGVLREDSDLFPVSRLMSAVGGEKAELGWGYVEQI
jgi:hypothetical protein